MFSHDIEMDFGLSDQATVTYKGLSLAKNEFGLGSDEKCLSSKSETFDCKLCYPGKSEIWVLGSLLSRKNNCDINETRIVIFLSYGEGHLLRTVCEYEETQSSSL